MGLRIDYVLVAERLTGTLISCGIDRNYRKGKPTPSDHAPLLCELNACVVLAGAPGAGDDVGPDRAVRPPLRARRAPSRPAGRASPGSSRPPSPSARSPEPI